MLTLRPYQEAILEGARAEIRKGCKRVFIQSSTGSGKTVIAAKMLQNASTRGYRAWFAVHRRELVKQSVLTLTEAADLNVGVIAAGFPADRHQLVQVCSVGTLPRRMDRVVKPKLVIWDEAHHCPAASWAALAKQLPDAVHIGLSATPMRLDSTGLAPWFDHLIPGPTVRELIDQGYLSDYRLFAPKAVSMDGVHTVAGDWNRRELAERMAASTVTGDAITEYKRHAGGKRALIFMWSVESSMQMAAQFNAAGVPAAHIDGGTSDYERDHAVDDFRSGRVRVLTNVNLVSEGFDLPSLEAVFLLRPTKSLAMYLQMVGRAMRPAEGKSEALIFDHSGLAAMHGLPDDDREWTLEGRRRSTADRSAPVRQCAQCFATVAAAALECRHCGYVFVAAPREVERVDGELIEMDKERVRRDAQVEQARAHTVEELTAIGRMRGYKHAAQWAQHVFDARRKRA